MSICNDVSASFWIEPAVRDAHLVTVGIKQEAIREAEEITKDHMQSSVTLSDIIAEETKGKQVSKEIIESLIQVESRGNPDAIGDNGEAIGLGQIQPRWHKERMQRLGVTDLKDPRQNVKVIVDIMDELINKYGNIEAALTAYNAGHDTGDRSYANRIYKILEEKWTKSKN